MVVEVMGRNSGWIAVGAGLAGGAEVLLIPEDPFDIDDVCKRLIHRHKSYAKFSIVVVAEGAIPKKGTAFKFKKQYDSVGNIIAGSIGYRVMEAIQQRTGIDTRVTVLGHVQRGGTPTPNDRNIASAYGVAAVDALSAGRSSVMTGLVNEKIRLIPFAEVAGKQRHVAKDMLDVAKALI
jgi:6-phosphofructokinase 1